MADDDGRVFYRLCCFCRYFLYCIIRRTPPPLTKRFQNGQVCERFRLVACNAFYAFVRAWFCSVADRSWMTFGVISSLVFCSLVQRFWLLFFLFLGVFFSLWWDSFFGSRLASSVICVFVFVIFTIFVFTLSTPLFPVSVLSPFSLSCFPAFPFC